MASRYSPFSVLEGKALSTELGYLAQTVVVDNLTASWIFIQQAGRYVPPFTYGATFGLGAGVQVAQATWQTPPGIVAPTVGAGQAQLTFTSEALPPSNGQQVIVPSQQVPCNATAGANAVQVTPTTFKTGLTGVSPLNAVVVVNVPAGANSVALVGPLSAFTTSVQMVGVQTGTTYMSVTAGNSSSGFIATPLFALIETGADKQVTLTITVGAGDVSGSGVLQVVANFGTQVVAVENTGTPLQVTGIGGTPVVTQFGPIAAGFQQLGSAANTLNLLSLPAPGAGRVNRLSQLNVSWFGAAPAVGTPIFVEDSTNTIVWILYVEAAQKPTQVVFTVPLAVSTGDGTLKVGANPGGGAAVSVLSGAYSVY